MTGMSALLLYAAWTLVLMLIYVGYRVAAVQTQGKSADSWSRDRAAEVPDFFARAQHAHLNCVENLPVFAVVVLAAYALGRPGVADALGVWVLLARIGQSAVHLYGVNHLLVQIRAGFFTAQVLLIFYMILALL